MIYICLSSFPCFKENDKKAPPDFTAKKKKEKRKLDKLKVLNSFVAVNWQ